MTTLLRNRMRRALLPRSMQKNKLPDRSTASYHHLRRALHYVKNVSELIVQHLRPFSFAIYYNLMNLENHIQIFT